MIRGARQVGKSFLVRLLAAETFDNLIDINLEADPEAPSLFASKVAAGEQMGIPIG